MSVYREKYFQGYEGSTLACSGFRQLKGSNYALTCNIRVDSAAGVEDSDANNK